MNTDEHIQSLRSEADAFATTLKDADLDAPVETCPEWQIRDLTEHVGHLYRWAAKIVGERIGSALWPMQVEFPKPDAPAGTDAWIDWLRTGVTDATELFANTPPSEPVWGWGADQHARFWPRRMLYETVVHRADLCFAGDVAFVLDPVVAVEGIDEHLENLRFIAQWQPSLVGLAGNGERIVLQPTDVDASWRIRLADSGWWWDRSPRNADATLSGPVTDLLLWLQGRPAPATERSGAGEVLARWEDAFAF